MQNHTLREMTADERAALLQETRQAYEAFKAKGLSLNMSRGTPSKEQLDLTMPMLDTLNSQSDPHSSDGIDCRNYGQADGIPEAKQLFADLLCVPKEEVFVGGNSSLELMFGCVQTAYVRGIAGCAPWHTLDEVKFLCPVPGYDRHFLLTNYFGLRMVPIPLTPDGPDMDIVQKYVESDESVKGIWCVPVYANPTGIVYSDETVRRFAALQPAARDFRIYWDNAYIVHHLVENPKTPLSIYRACHDAGSPKLYYQFVSTSKITFSGAGVAAINADPETLKELSGAFGIQTIGFDKMNQLRHVRFFKTADNLRAHMDRHREILAPKFQLVADTFERELTPLGIGSWTKPEGGYFVSFQAPRGCAKRIFTLCKEAGVTLTKAGATFPYGVDPEDSNIRIAPTYPPLDELRQALELFCTCVKLAALEQYE